MKNLIATLTIALATAAGADTITSTSGQRTQVLVSGYAAGAFTLIREGREYTMPVDQVASITFAAPPAPAPAKPIKIDIGKPSINLKGNLWKDKRVVIKIDLRKYVSENGPQPLIVLHYLIQNGPQKTMCVDTLKYSDKSTGHWMGFSKRPIKEEAALQSKNLPSCDLKTLSPTTLSGSVHTSFLNKPTILATRVEIWIGGKLNTVREDTHKFGASIPKNWWADKTPGIKRL